MRFKGKSVFASCPNELPRLSPSAASLRVSHSRTSRWERDLPRAFGRTAGLFVLLRGWRRDGIACKSPFLRIIGTPVVYTGRGERPSLERALSDDWSEPSWILPLADANGRPHRWR